MISLFVDFFNFLGAFLNLVINISYYLGKLLVAVGAWTYELLTWICSNLGKLCVVLYEDFSYFSSDIGTYLQAIGNTINNGFKCVIDGIVSGVYNTVETCKRICAEGGFKFSSLITAISDLIGLLLVKLRELLILIGNGTWFLITFLPNLLTALAIVTWNFCHDMWNHLKVLTKVTTDKISIAIETAYNYFFDVPLHCAIGLLMLYICFRYRHKIFNSLRIFVQRIWFVFQQSFNTQRQRTRRRQEIREEEVQIHTPPLFAPTINGPSTRKPLRRSPRNPIQKGKSPNTSQDSSLSCVVCLDRKKTVLVLPCRHLCLCRQCSNMSANFQNTCPLCRNEITETIDTYI